MQKLFEQSENKAVLVFVSVAVIAHFVLLMLFEIV